MKNNIIFSLSFFALNFFALNAASSSGETLSSDNVEYVKDIAPIAPENNKCLNCKFHPIYGSFSLTIASLNALALAANNHGAFSGVTLNIPSQIAMALFPVYAIEHFVAKNEAISPVKLQFFRAAIVGASLYAAYKTNNLSGKLAFASAAALQAVKILEPLKNN